MVEDYQLRPLSIEVYDQVVGIVHYTYSATVAPNGATSFRVTGKWTEIYLKQDGQWVMIGSAEGQIIRQEVLGHPRRLAARPNKRLQATRSKQRAPEAIR